MSPLKCPSSNNTIEIMITEYFIEVPNTNIKEPVEGFAYDVLVNYIVGETDATGYTPKVNRTILIDNNNRKVVVNDYKLLEIITTF